MSYRIGTKTYFLQIKFHTFIFQIVTKTKRERERERESNEIGYGKYILQTSQNYK